MGVKMIAPMIAFMSSLMVFSKRQGRLALRVSVATDQWDSRPFGFGPLYRVFCRVEGSLPVAHISNTGPHFVNRVVGSGPC